MESLEKRGMDRKIVEAVFDCGITGREDLANREKMENLACAVEGLGQTVYSIEKDEEHDLLSMSVALASKGKREMLVDLDLLSSAEFKKIKPIYASLVRLHASEIFVQENGKKIRMESKDRLLDYLMESVKKGLVIQRYKGLGEMNPDQLWETTMNPEKRKLLQVKIDDFYEANDIFTILMGDQVEPRRKFIEENALNVQNLDI
jgi:DNA gyrase subunit B